MTLLAIPIVGIPEVKPGDDLARFIVDAIGASQGPNLTDGDVLVVTSKVVSKAEGRVVRGRDRDEVIAEETRRVVAAWSGPQGRTIIAQTRHGLVLASAGVDASNTEPGTLVLLPVDPDASAARLRGAIRGRTGVNVAVVISDSMGRPWRQGLTDVAIGAAGMWVLDDLRGLHDNHGNRLDASVRAVADEAAGTAELVATKTASVPAVVVRGLADHVLPPTTSGPGAGALIRPQKEDRFLLGTSEAMREAITERRTIRQFSDDPVPVEALRRAAAAASTAPSPHHATPWRFVLVDTPDVRDRLLDSLRDQWIADLRSDGIGSETIDRRVVGGDVLRRAPSLVVPCLVDEDMHGYSDQRRSAAEKTMFVLAVGAAVQNLLLSLAADGLGSAWIGSALFAQDLAREVLDLSDTWHPMGVVAIGYPRTTPPRRPSTLDEPLTVV